MIAKTHLWTPGHQGGRFTAKDLQRQLMLKSNSKKCDVFGVTEAIGLPKLEGWGRRGAECKVYWNKDIWKHLDHDNESVRTNKWIRGTSRRSSVEWFWITLHHEVQNWKLLRLEAHLPAHLFIDAQERANRAALMHIAPLIKELVAEYEPDEIDLGMDLNREITLKRNQDLVKQALKGTGLHMIVPPSGTFKKRHIDLICSTGHGTPHMFNRHAGFDHRGYYADLTA